MKVIQVYKCLCDIQRLRILNLLKDGGLCVCHLMEILNSDQVKISKQLRYMKELGLVRSKRQAQWMVYEIVDPKNPLLIENLKCLQDWGGETLYFAEDLKKRRSIIKQLKSEGSAHLECIY